MQLVSSNKNLDKTDYKSLYHNLFRHLTSIHNMIEHAQKDIEEQYLIQTEGKVPPKTGIVIGDLLRINPDNLIRYKKCGIKTVQETIAKMYEEGFTEWATSYETWIKKMWPDEVRELMEITDTDPPYNIGDIIQFGRRFRNIYSWRVLDIKDNKALLFSENAVARLEYFNKSSTTWTNSNARRYLNGKFLSHFNPKQQARIVKTTIPNTINPWYGTIAGANTTDAVFLLSIEQVVKYFGDSGILLKRPPNEKLIDDQYNSNRSINEVWWLLTPGKDNEHVACVYYNGEVHIHGYKGTRHGIGIRPAMWVRM